MKQKTLTKLSIMLLIGIIGISCTKAKDSKDTKEPKEAIVVSSTTPGSIGSKAADFTLTDLEGKEVKLDDFKDKVIVLNFWATWCPPCRAEIPDFIKMYEKHEKEGMVILGVGGFREGLEKIKPFVETNGINYPVLIVKEDAIKSLVDSYGGIEGIPTTFLIDKTGTIQEKWVGPRSEEVFMEEINKYLK